MLDLLEFFAERGRPASLADVSENFEWPLILDLQPPVHPDRTRLPV
ncbi:hypothetical protein [Pseudooceanicola sp.]